MKVGFSQSKNFRPALAGLLAAFLIGVLLVVAKTSSASSETETSSEGFAKSLANDALLPAQIDVRGGTPRGLDLRGLTAVQSRALTSLQSVSGNNLSVRYNGLTATPMNIYNPGGYLTAPDKAAPEKIARDFVRRWREVFRFDEADLSNLKLISRATTQEGTTVLLFQQRAGNLPVYHGEVLVNVNKAGQIINVGGDSFPRLSLTNSAAISPATAVSLAATDMGITGFTANSLGATQILATYGDLPTEYATGEKFAHGVFSDDINVQTIVFPLGDQGRIAYQFNLVTPQFRSIMWQVIVDAQTGAILRRISLTAAQKGGGNSIPRKGTFRPDVQNMIESYSASGGQGKVFDLQPTTFSAVSGAGRALRSGTNPSNFQILPPTYNPETPLTNHFRYSLVAARNEVPLPFTPTSGLQSLTPNLIGQVLRGLPDATHPSASSPFGWFYLPSDSGGRQITTANNDHGTTQTLGYTMATEAQSRNIAANSPNGNGTQPFSADSTALNSTATLADGRSLSSVFQSRYSEGNNVSTSDDRANDNDATRGIRGYAANRQFNAAYFDYYAYYEFGGTDASGGGTGSTTPVTYPASADPDVYPATVNLFYFNNVEHDYLYSIGFTEPFWNFQFDNFGKGGAGNDGIVAEVQDGSGTDNANMSTPAEGSSPRMQMYLFTDGGLRRSDGDLDWDVVAHEHYHGVSNRSAAKGGDSCLGTPLVGESGGMGEGWSDFIASSMADDESEGEYVTGEFDKGIRRSSYTNYRYSYGSINDVTLNLRKNTNTETAVPDQNAGGIPFEVHDIGEVWAATLWDMRELMILKNPNGVLFDGNRRLGGGSTFFVGNRQVQSLDANHPINYRAALNDTTTTPGLGGTATLNAASIVRPGLVANENANNPTRGGALALAVSEGARLADKVTLRGLQLAVCNPTFVDMRDSMLAADREISGGENQAIMWRAFASHGVGTNATSTGKTNGIGQQGGPAAIAEDFTVPAGVTECETLGPLPAPTFTLSNTTANTVTVTITPVSGAASYVIARSTDPNGNFKTVATVSGTTYNDDDNGAGLVLGQTYYYEVHAARSQYCVGLGAIKNITVTVGTALSPAPVFAGLGQVSDPKSGLTLNLSWSPATSTNPGANVVYDIYRVINVAPDTDLQAPSFTPAAGNRIAAGVTGTTFTDKGLTLGQQYYYIVQARDTTNGKIDSDNTGNAVTKLNAPSSTAVSPTAPFALETFETAAADNRFIVPLVEPTSNVPDHGTAAFQRVNADLTGGTTNLNDGDNAAQALTGAMFAPDFDPGNSGMGGPSDFAVTINPVGLTRASFLEFDHRYSTEATFDGGNLEIVLGSAVLPVTPSPNNTTTFDLNDYIVEETYNGNLDGAVAAGVQGSPLLGRRAFTGSKTVSHVRVALGDFAAGGVKNPSGLPVYVRFHSTSDAGTFVDGWYIDNLVVNNFVPTGYEADVSTRPNGDGAVTSSDVSLIQGFQLQLGMPYQSNEFQRADCAPFSTKGDGAITSIDVSQAQGYQLGLNLTDSSSYQPAAGPTAPTATPQPTFAPLAALGALKSKSKSGTDDVIAGVVNRVVRVVNTSTSSGQNVIVPIGVDAAGDESVYGFSINYDATKLSNPVVTIGNAGGAVASNTTQAGRIGVSVTFGGGTINAGDNQVLVNVRFTVAANAAAGDTPVTFGDQPTQREVASAPGSPGGVQVLPTTFTNGTVTIARPTAATVTISGRVILPQNIGLTNALVTLTDSRGIARTQRSGNRGVFRFSEVAAGETYVISVSSRRYRFDPQVVNPTQNISDLTFDPVE